WVLSTKRQPPLSLFAFHSEPVSICLSERGVLERRTRFVDWEQAKKRLRDASNERSAIAGCRTRLGDWRRLRQCASVVGQVGSYIACRSSFAGPVALLAVSSR